MAEECTGASWESQALWCEPVRGECVRGVCAASVIGGCVQISVCMSVSTWVEALSRSFSSHGRKPRVPSTC